MISETASKFMQYDYAEIKELSTQFLTLITAVLVFSLAFSEKIIEFRKTIQTVRNILVTAWSCFFVAIIGCGLSLVLNVYAASEMLYGPNDLSAFTISYYAALSLLIAGCVFVFGLACLIVAAFLGRRPSGPPSTHSDQ